MYSKANNMQTTFKVLWIIFYVLVFFTTLYICIFIAYMSCINSLYNRALSNISHDMLLSKMLDSTVNNVPFYTDALKGKQITLSNFPIVSKKFIRDNQDSMISKSLLSKRYLESVSSANNSWTQKEVVKKDITTYEGCKMLYHLITGGSIAQTTGGSSGEYFYQWFSIGDFWGGAYSFVKGWVNMGWTPSDTVFLYYFHGANSVKIANKLNIPGFPLFSSIPKVNSEGDITLESYKDFIEVMENKKPNLIISFPSIIYRIAQLAYEHNYTFIHVPKFMDLSADFLFSCQYEFIKTIFKTTEIRLTYGTIEYGQIAQQIKGSMFDYEVYDDIAVVEQGSKGGLIITSLIYNTQPIIRYEIDDIGKIEYDTYRKKHIIRNLIGKPPTLDVNYIDIDAYINEFNTTYKSGIINVRINSTNHTIIVTTIVEDAIPYIAAYFRTGNINYKIIPMICKKNECKTIDRYDRKNTPVLKQYSNK